jgi:hypothetical protein
MAAAIRMADALKRHALIAFDCMGADTAMDDARMILSWIQRERCESFTRRDCHSAHKYKFKRADALDVPLSVLEERGYIRRCSPVSGPKGGRPKCTYDVNPSAHREGLR